MCGAFLLSAVAGISGCIGTHSENSRLKAEIERQKGALHAKDAEIAKINNELGPFRNLAVQEFNKADAQSMKRLAETMATLRKDYTASLDTLNSNRAEIEELRLKLRPKPLDERLRAFLDSVDPKILVGLKSGTSRAQGDMAITKVAELEALCAEPGAQKYITLKKLGGQKFMSDGTITTGVELSFGVDLIPQASRNP